MAELLTEYWVLRGQRSEKGPRFRIAFHSGHLEEARCFYAGYDPGENWLKVLAEFQAGPRELRILESSLSQSLLDTYLVHKTLRVR